MKQANFEPTFRVSVSDRLKPLGWFWSHAAAAEWVSLFLAAMPETQLAYVSVTIDEVL